jgi:hypothetical protein
LRTQVTVIAGLTRNPIALAGEDYLPLIPPSLLVLEKITVFIGKKRANIAFLTTFLLSWAIHLACIINGVAGQARNDGDLRPQ